MDAALSARILQAVRQVLAMEEVRSRLVGLGGVPLGEDGMVLGALLGTELDRWTRMVRDKGITE